MSKKGQKVVLFFDGDCDFCTAMAKVAKRLPLRAEFRTMQSVDLISLGVDPVRARLEVPSRFEDGTVVYGHRAIAAALKTGTLPLRSIGQAMTWGPMNRLSTWCYRAVSSHRHQLSRGNSACKHA